MHFEIHKYYPEHPNLPYRCEYKRLHYWEVTEKEMIDIFNNFVWDLKRSEGGKLEWKTDQECIHIGGKRQLQRINIRYKIVKQN